MLGRNDWGQLGNGAFLASSIPVLAATDVVAAAAGHESTCAVHGDGSVSCWGACTLGQCGDGVLDTTDTLDPVVGLPIAGP